MHFERFFLPDEYHGTPEYSSAKLQEKIKELQDNILNIDNKILSVLENSREDFLLANQVLYRFNKVFEVRKYAAATRDNRKDKKVFYIICGALSVLRKEIYQK